MGKKLVVIGGPTATGKTALALRLAREIDGEIVSADARQIYREMDIGTGKELPANLKFDFRNNFTAGCYVVNGARIWLYDVVAPDQPFSAADYRQIAWPVVEDIWRRRKMPLVVGGTGFYIKSLLHGFDSEGIPPDWALRRELDSWTVVQLVDHFKKMAPEKWKRMNESDRKNPRRLIRALEIGIREQGLGSSERRKNGKKPAPSPYSLTPLFIGLTAPHEELYRRIDERVEEMMNAGLLDEVKTLVKQYTWSAPGLNGIGYRQFRPFLEGKNSLEECVKRVKFDSHAYARRQMTWFRREPKMHWFDITRTAFDEQVLKLVESFR